MKTVFAFATLVLAMLPARALATTFTINSALSYIDATQTTFVGAPLSPQAPGSLVAPVQGTLEAIVTPGTIEFPGGSNMDLISHAGLFSPGNAPADLAGFVLVFSGAMRDAVLDVSAGPSPLISGVFDSESSLEFLSGTISVTFAAGAADLTSMVVPSTPATDGTFTQVGNFYQIVLPINTLLVFDIDEPGDEKLKIPLTGQIVATTPIPEPASAVSASLALAGVASAVMFRRRRRSGWRQSSGT